MLISQQSKNNYRISQSKAKNLRQHYSVQRTPALPAAANFSSSNLHLNNLRPAKAVVQTAPFTHFIQNGRNGSYNIHKSRKLARPAATEATPYRQSYYGDTKSMMMQHRPLVSVDPSSRLSHALATSSDYASGADANIAHLRKSVKDRMEITRSEGRTMRRVSNSKTKSHSQTMLRNQQSCSKTNEAIAVLGRFEDKDLFYATHSPLRQNHIGRPESQFSVSRAGTAAIIIDSSSHNNHDKRKRSQLSNIKNWTMNSDHLIQMSQAEIMAGHQGTTRTAKSQLSKKRVSYANQQQTQPHRVQLPTQPTPQPTPQPKIQMQVSQDKSALTRFLYSMLATTSTNSVSQQAANWKTQINGVSPKININPVSILTTEKKNTAAAPVIRQLPTRFYKGIIETMKRKRLKNLGPAVSANWHDQTRLLNKENRSKLQVAQLPDMIEEEDDKAFVEDIQVIGNKQESPVNYALYNLMPNLVIEQKKEEVHGTICVSTEKIPSDTSPSNFNKFSHRKQIESIADIELKVLEEQKDFNHQPQATVDGLKRNMSLIDLEAKFQEECDHLMGSISQNWNTIQEFDSGRLETSVMQPFQDEYKSIGAEVGDPSSINSLSREEIHQTTTQACAQMPEIRRVYQHQQPHKSTSVRVQGLKAPLKLRKSALTYLS